MEQSDAIWNDVLNVETVTSITIVNYVFFSILWLSVYLCQTPYIYKFNPSFALRSDFFGLSIQKFTRANKRICHATSLLLYTHIEIHVPTNKGAHS